MRAAGGRVSVRLDEAERRILASLVAELRGELGDPSSSAAGGALWRLYPPAFPDDADAEAAYRELVQDGLVADRMEHVATVEATLGADELDEAQAAAWLHVLNDLRLALGSSLGIEQDGDEIDPPAGDGSGEVDDPDALRRAIFLYLGWLVQSFADVLAESLPDAPEAGS
jgi:hypothetical protein